MNYHKLLFFAAMITKSDVNCQCTNVHYPVGLRANSLKTKYYSMDTDMSGNIVLGGSTMSATLTPGFPISLSAFGAPIFQMYDTSICRFTWSIYVNRNIGVPKVPVTFRSDMS